MDMDFKLILYISFGILVIWDFDFEATHVPFLLIIDNTSMVNIIVIVLAVALVHNFRLILIAFNILRLKLVHWTPTDQMMYSFK